MQIKILATLPALAFVASTIARAEEQSTKAAAPTAQVELQQIRNATARISFGETTFLIDPMLSKKGTYPGFANTYRSELRNPLVELPMPAEDVVAGVDAVIVTHTHLDHWDDAAQATLPKVLPLFVQHDADAAIIRAQGFTDVRVLGHHVEFGGVILSKTGGQHGTDAMYATQPLAGLLGEAMGVAFEAPGYSTVYLAGDTIWRDEVDQALAEYNPSVIVLNAGYAKLTGFDGAIIMGQDDVLRAVHTVPTGTVVAVHLDAINHMALSRAELRKFVQEQGIQEQVEIPKDGESLKF